MADAKCMTCGAKAIWENMPSGCFGEYCDDCVPRGCGCNRSFDPETDEWDGPEDTDDEGRLLPCVEYWYHTDGFEHDAEGAGAYAARLVAALARWAA
jgi:hypothetical protein